MSGKRFDSEKAAFEEKFDDLTEAVTFVRTVGNYLTAMEEKSPDDSHPTLEWLISGFSKLSLVQNRSVPAPPESSSSDAIRDYISTRYKSMQARLDNYSDFQFRPNNHWRQFQLDRRDRDRQDWVSAFKAKAQKFHASVWHLIFSSTL